MKFSNINVLLILISFFVVVNSSFAKINFDVGIIHKKEVNEELVITNELYSVEEVDEEKFTIVEMNNGIQVKIKASFIKDIIFSYGPESYVKVSGHVLNSKGRIIYRLNEKEEIKGMLGKTIHLSFKVNDNELIELLLTPKIS